MTEHASLHDDRWAKVAIFTGAVALGVYAVLWCVMWIPSYIDGTGLLILYPLFLVAWIPIELLALLSMVCAIIALAKRQGRTAGTIGILVADVVFVVVSLPTLWFGEFPWYVFIPGSA
ncbi:hypothetical protein [Clavibacter phaseoli]|uniref:hypothetical protein n=1 Tax=Clavibacter phaseoli TaxID=1734031 RepID=UPI000E6694BC|nr:hypothetical protein [Clavibacter phaseoli]RIJ56678.1 hypothetical protein DZF99_05590 [Clavibacter phaseoli]UKF30520.1 hypothetical protein FGD69_05395 [Clavibacter phaseoli]UKF36438.1 hypothetical protein FGI33_04775 [Clavibacter phaseoli]